MNVITTQDRQAAMRLAMRVFCSLVIVGATLAATTGCRSTQRLLGNKDADARSGTVWNVPIPDLEPPSLDNKTVWVRWRNVSDAQDINLIQDIKSAVQESGYTIVDDPQAAQYRLRATLRFYGENDQADFGRGAVSARLGGIAGAAIGATAGYSIARAAGAGGGGRGLAGAGGAVVGGLLATAAFNRSKAREYNLVIDVLLEEYIAEGVEFDVDSGNDTRDSTGTATGLDRGGVVAGGQTRSTNSTTSITKKSNYFPHGMRLTAWARQVGMKEEEAMPLLNEKTRAVLPQILP